MSAVKKKSVKKPVAAARKPAKKVVVRKVEVPAVRPVVVNVTRAARPARREDPQWLVNFKDFAAKNPAATVVGILAVTLALILLLGR